MQTSIKFELKNTTPASSRKWDFSVTGWLAIPQLKKKIRRAAACSWTTTHTGGSDSLSSYFLRSDWKQNKRTDSLRVRSFPAIVLLPCILWRCLCCGDCPSYASACDGKTTLVFTPLWLSAEVRCFRASCSFLHGELAGFVTGHQP